MANEVYYSIIRNEERQRYEWHVSANREEVERRDSMSRAVAINSPNAADYVLRWQDQSVANRMVYVRDLGSAESVWNTLTETIPLDDK